MKEKIISELDAVQSDLAIVADIVKKAKALVEERSGPDGTYDVSEYIWQRRMELDSGIDLGNLCDSIVYLIEKEIGFIS
jgi:hypothetical protein